MEEPLNLRVDVSPDQSTLLLPGSITISKTTVSVFKLCEATDEEPLFIGVCMIPVLQLLRRRSTVKPNSDTLILMCLSEHLFMNASLSAGLAPSRGGSQSSLTTDSAPFSRTPKEDLSTAEDAARYDNPSHWRSIRLEFTSNEMCDRCVDALVARGAETMMSARGDGVSSSRAAYDRVVYDSIGSGRGPAGLAGAGNAMEATASETSSRRHHAHANRVSSPEHAGSDRMRTCHSAFFENSHGSRGDLHNSNGSQRRAHTPREGQHSRVPDPRVGSAHSHKTESQRGGNTPRTPRDRNPYMESKNSGQSGSKRSESARELYVYPAEGMRQESGREVPTYSSKDPRRTPHAGSKQGDSERNYYESSQRESQRPSNRHRPESAKSGSQTTTQNPGRQTGTERTGPHHESARELSKRESQRTPRESARESARDLSARESQRTPRDSARELSKRESQRTPRESARESARDLSARESQRTPRDSARELSKRESQRTPRDSARDSARELSKRESQRTPRDSARDSARELSKRESQRTPRDSARESARELSKRESQRTPRDSARESARDRFYSAIEPRDSLETPCEMSEDASESAFQSVRSPVDMSGVDAYGRPQDSQGTPRGLSRHSRPGSDRPHGVSRSAPLLGTQGSARENTEFTQPTYETSHPYGADHHLPMHDEANARPRPRPSVRTEHQIFMRNVMKLMHHRLHFMQYLHKEMVHQAYLAEEARLIGLRNRANAARSSASRMASASPRSPRRSAALSSVAEESARLREIERHLRELEELHSEAKREHKEAVRLRQELELERERKGNDANMSAVRHTQTHTEMQDESSLNDCVSSTGPSGGSRRVNSYINPRDIENQSNDHLQSRTASQRKTSGNEYMYYNGRQTAPGHAPNGFVVNGQMVPLLPHPEDFQVDESSFATAIVDRYVYGDEWHLVYPSRTADVRFNALVDVSLALKVPRRFVTIMNVAIDQPGLRITAEIRHNLETLPRELLERRFANQPFRFLERLYELRHTYTNGTAPPPVGDMVVPYMSGSSQCGPARSARRVSQVTTPRGTARRVSAADLRNLNPVDNYYRMESAYGDDYVKEELGVESAMRDLQLRTDESGRQRQQELERERIRKRHQLKQEHLRNMRAQLDTIEHEEDLCRSRVILNEAEERQELNLDAPLAQRQTAFVTVLALEEAENVQRAIIEVGHARQAQVIAQAQQRKLALVRFAAQEEERRARHVETEFHARQAMEVMNPMRLPSASSVTDTEMDERLRRVRLAEAEAKHRNVMYETLRGFLFGALQDELEALMQDEKTARIVLAADEMKAWIDIVCAAQDAQQGGVVHARGVVSPQAWQALMAEEAAGREHNVNDELRRRHLFQREYIVSTEDVMRDAIELGELDEHIVLIDDMVHRNRAMLERRMDMRKQTAKLANEEQYYRKEILSDEQEAWETNMEHFDAEMHDVLLAEATKLAMASDFESPRRRRRTTGTPRQTKPFHYMTFAQEDMEHPPSGALAIEGILGCSINKNLEVTSIARPLPKVEEEELQFLAGDMILDVAGFSLHSLSHLREVLAHRTMQIQHEAREEFPNVPESDLTVNPALQKYVEVLCEHHNFLVQVLRGCDIFQIIVKS